MATTGYHGTYVIPWSNVLVDDCEDLRPEDLRVGSTWEWRGCAYRIDGPTGLLTLGPALGEVEIRDRIGRKSRKLFVKEARNTANSDEVEVQPVLGHSGFVVTNGARQFFASVMFTNGSAPLVAFCDGVPPKQEELWVASVQRPAAPMAQPTGMMCFTPETRIATPKGPRPVGALRPGDLVATRDNGPQPVLWAGQRRISGLRLAALPGLRPVRVRHGVLGSGCPDGDLVLSPDHRLLVDRPEAQDLFGTRQVLVRAGDLIDDARVVHDLPPEGVTYCHLLLPRHEILFANGVPCESLHPADMAPDTLPGDACRALTEAGLHRETYGPHARRALTRSESALVMHAAA